MRANHRFQNVDGSLASVAAGVLACRRAGASRPTEKALVCQWLSKISKALTVRALLPGGRMPPSTAGETPAATGSPARFAAFSLIEILVVVGLLSIIILGLVAMFSQTQRAFRLGLAQVDVLESGRAVTDMMTRELSQMTPSRASNAVNFYVSLESVSPLKQELPGNPAPLRTNLIEEMYFLTKENQAWAGIGYFVFPANGGVGTLYRYGSNTVFGQNPSQLYNGYNLTLNDAINRNVFTNLNRIMDGVVHFKVRAYTPDGQWITTTNQFATNQFGAVVNAEVREPGAALYAAGESEFYRFTTNVVPAFVELELGVLEERAIVRARTITDPLSRSNYLAREAGKVHLFRLRVPVRNVDPVAYQ